jgi:hypothetical protein
VASTVYYQQATSTSYIHLCNLASDYYCSNTDEVIGLNKQRSIGSFTLSAPTIFDSNSTFRGWEKREIGICTSAGITFFIATSTDFYQEFYFNPISFGGGETSFNQFDTTGSFSTTTLPAGNYNVYVYSNCSGDRVKMKSLTLNGNDFYGIITDTGGYTPPIPHIQSLTFSTTTAIANITGYWEATTTPYVSQKLSFWQFSNALGKESYVQLVATTTGYFNFSFTFKDPYSFTATTSTTTAPIYSIFTLNASLDQYDETNYVFPYGGTIINNIDATSTTISAVDNYNASDFISSPRALALYPEYECGITSLTGCFKNAIIWAFYPTQEALDNWSSLFTVIQTKAPIGYFYVAKNGISGLSATSTKAFNVVIPSSLKTYIFNPFDIGISGILWLFFVFNFYKRLKIITI